MEGCQSGLMDMLGKHAWGKPHREFESPPFRSQYLLSGYAKGYTLQGAPDVYCGMPLW